MASLHQARGGASAAVLNDLLYVVGGTAPPPVGIVATGEVYDAHANVWNQLPSMNRHRNNASLCTLQNCIYAVGGFDGYFYLSSVERFDPREGKWTEVRLPNFLCLIL